MTTLPDPDRYLPDGTTVGYVHLGASDPRGLAAFYRERLGFRLIAEASGTWVLSADGRPPLHLAISPASAPRRRTAGLYHLAVLYPTRQVLAGVLARLLASGWPLQGAADHGVSEAIYLADPEGNGVEIYADRDPDVWPRRGGALAMVTRPLDLDGLLRLAAPDREAAGGRIGHVHLHVTDLDRADGFYADALGFVVTQRSYPGARFYAAGDYHHHVGVNIWAGTDLPSPQADAPGLREFSVRLPSAAAWPAVRARLGRHRVAVEDVRDRGEHLAVRVRDPDGIAVVVEVPAGGPLSWPGRPAELPADG
ncbi:MAG: VOC family protein [Armatimonadota bacterium]|nr:VOC family protein [Armatimonadota bacterium]MDR7402600.1 VOC family protein [Armatimonadota bacterium]MDR7436798.1 VOC family protein [Armatimonadota bacterium]MDR7472745.1 VOC family protein [Armatimonadota bacterium]MDR7507321.1 VOC family protein [Armatimonadota bacterium]